MKSERQIEWIFVVRWLVGIKDDHLVDGLCGGLDDGLKVFDGGCGGRSILGAFCGYAESAGSSGFHAIRAVRLIGSHVGEIFWKKGVVVGVGDDDFSLMGMVI